MEEYRSNPQGHGLFQARYRARWHIVNRTAFLLDRGHLAVPSSRAMPLFTHIDTSLGPQGEVPAERIEYHVLAKRGQFYKPGDWRQLDPMRPGKTLQFVTDGEWRAQHRPASPGAEFAWNQEAIPARAREELAEHVAAKLETEGHRVFGKVEMS